MEKPNAVCIPKLNVDYAQSRDATMKYHGTTDIIASYVENMQPFDNSI